MMLTLGIDAGWPRAGGIRLRFGGAWLAFALLFMGSQAWAAAPGDLNNDGAVSVADATLALQMAMGLIVPTSDQLVAGDVAPVTNGIYGDGKMDVGDAIRILRRAIGIDSATGWPGAQSFNTPASACTMTLVTPEETEGPYFVDEMLNRSDIRSDPSDNSVQAGVPLRLAITVSRIDTMGACAPLTGARVDIWHCNAQGIYSDENANSSLGKKFLRGYQVTDSSGAVQFTTIYPGWYMGRTVHIHIKVRIFSGTQKTFEFTSQFFFDDSITDQVFAQAPYNARGHRDTTNRTDGIFLGPSADGTVQSNSGDHLLLNLTGNVQQGFVGTFHVGVNAP